MAKLRRYGKPQKRDPQRVADDVNRKWLRPELAKEIFGVALTLGENGVDYAVDQAATQSLRNEVPS